MFPFSHHSTYAIQRFQITSVYLIFLGKPEKYNGTKAVIFDMGGVILSSPLKHFLGKILLSLLPLPLKGKR